MVDFTGEKTNKSKKVLREELHDCCPVCALKMAGIDEPGVNTARHRMIGT
jgi:hypothetical protein